jgi:hypothetical protein
VLLGETAEFEIRPAGESLIETVPNKNVTAAFRVTNKAEIQDFTTEVGLPEGWKLITKDFPFFLEKNQTDLRLISIYVPPSTTAGKYEVTYQLRGRKFPSIRDSYSFWVVVSPYRKLSMNVLQAPEFVIAGESYQVMLQILNESNVCDQLVLKVQCIDSLSIKPEVDHFTIPSGQYRTVNVHILTDAKALEPGSQTVYYTIHCADQKESQAETQSSVKIIPRVMGAEDRYFRLPVQLSAAFVTQRQDGKTNSGIQGNAFGSGTLDEKGTKSISFHFRGPDAYRRSISVFAERDEYTASYWTKRFAIHVGDRPFTLTQLSQNSRYGRGVELGFSPNAEWSFGTYYQNSRWYMSDSKSFASFVKYQPNDRGAFQLSYLDNHEIDQEGKLLSASADFNPFKNTRVELEVASGSHRGEFEKGIQANVMGNLPFATCQVEWIYASPDFPGYYRDTNLLSTGLILRPIDKLSLNFSYRSDRQNFEMDTTRYVAPISRFFQSGISYQFIPQLRASIDFNTRSTKDRMADHRFDYSESSGRFMLNPNFWKLTLSLSAEQGQTQNNLYGKSSAMGRYMANLHFEPLGNQSYDAYLYYEENNRYSDKKTRMTTMGFNVRFLVSRKMEFRMNFQNNYTPEDAYMDRNISELSFKYLLPNKNSIQLRGRLTLLRNSMDRTDKALVVEYTAPIGIPVQVRKNSCIVKGRVIDMETRLPVRDMIIRINGSTAVTDADGNFIFRNLKEKTYYLILDKAAVGLNRVPVQKMPMEIHTVPGKEGKIVEIGLIRSASVSGRVMIASRQEKQPAPGSEPAAKAYVVGEGVAGEASKADSSLANILVEMSRNDETLRRVTDSKGGYTFDELRPGNWTIKFYDYNLPQYHQFENVSSEIELKPGDRKVLDAPVFPQKRRIRFMQNGGVIKERFR